MTKNLGYAHQQVRVNGLPSEYVIHIRAVAVELAGKPSHRVCLGMPVEFCLYHIADVTHRLSFLLIYVTHVPLVTFPFRMAVAVGT